MRTSFGKMVVVLMIVLGLTGLLAYGNDMPVKKGLIKGDWFQMLPETQKENVLEIFNQNLSCLTNREEGTAPDFDGWMENVSMNLRDILSPAQFRMFIKQSSQPIQLSRVMIPLPGPCSSCSSAEFKLGQLVDRLDSALAAYVPANCTSPPVGMPDSIYTCMYAARLYANRALTHAHSAAMCNRSEAVNAKADTQTAQGYIDSAIIGTNNKCDPKPWLTYLNSADYVAGFAISMLNSCISQIDNM